MSDWYMLRKDFVDSRVIVIAIAFLLAMITAQILTPVERMSTQRQQFDIRRIVPQQFGSWSLVVNANTGVVDPELRSKVESAYSQIISRTYRDASGHEVMLSIAYGGDQEDMMQVHRPEVCYVAQGFSMQDRGTRKISTAHGTVKAKLLLAKQAERIEPITYWIKIGDAIAVNGVAWRIERIRYGLSGSIPDGLLFRVSSIGGDIRQQYQIQALFIQALAASLTAEQYKQILGKDQLN